MALMQIHCRCRSCDKKFKVDAKLAGRKLRCSKCGGEVVVPPMATALDDEEEADGSVSYLDLPAVTPESATPRPGSSSKIRPGSSSKLRSAAGGGSSTSRHSAVRPARKSQTPLILAAVIGILLIGGGVLVFLSAARDPVLLLEWPVEDRADASLTVDRKEIPLTAEMPMRVTVTPGQHQVMIRRRGFEPYEWNINVDRGDQQTLKPEWKAMPTVSPQ